MNLIFGRNIFGRWIFGGGVTGDSGGGQTDPQSLLPLAPGEFSLRVYNADGTKTAEYGSGIKSNPVSSLSFELSTSGCGKIEFTLGELPEVEILNYGSRIDVHLFNDTLPWYSGYIVTKPVKGTTIKPYKFVGHGYIEQLKWVTIDHTYENMDVSSIAADIIKTYVEPNTGIRFRQSKITPTGYAATKIRFDRRAAYDAIKELSEYATGYVFGIDAYREFFFRPVQNEVNEQARLWVGEHINSFEPTEDIGGVVNRAYIKGAALDSNGSNIMSMVEDAASQATYGLREAVLDVPSAVTATDAQRWGTTEIDKRKLPIKRAKISGLRLEYRNADGSFNVRRITPQGKAAITTLPIEKTVTRTGRWSDYAGKTWADLEGLTWSDLVVTGIELQPPEVSEYPVTKMKYLIVPTGITADLELGEQSRRLEDYFVQLFREKKQADHLQSLNNLQLKGGSL